MVERAYKLLLVGVLGILVIIQNTEAQEINVALGKPTVQNSNLNFSGFEWTSEKAVDGCLNTTNPDESQCCSASLGTTDNFWELDLQLQYSVTRIVVYGRSDATAATGGQLDNFLIFALEQPGNQETLIYNNTGVPYGNGTFTIDVSETPITALRIRRPSASILTLCEVQVFAIIASTEEPSVTSDDSILTSSETPDVTPDTTDDTVSVSVPDGISSTTLSSGSSSTDFQGGRRTLMMSLVACAFTFLLLLSK